MKNVALVGATGLVGEKLLNVLRNNLADKIKLQIYGNKSVGKRLLFGDKWVTVESVDKLMSQRPDFALFATDNDVSLQYIPQLSKNGVVCIDNSSAFRMREDVPLVVPSVNPQTAFGAKIIANPNCVTIPIAMILSALRCLTPTAVTVATYQSASGAGREGLSDLTLRRKPPRAKCFTEGIADNVIPKIGEICPDGYTSEEHKLIDESRKILGLPDLAVNCMCVRVPVTVGHCCFVNVRFQKTFTLDKVKQLLGQSTDLIVLDKCLPMPSLMRNTKYVGVGRLTKDVTCDNGLNLFAVSDNLLRGAAVNAYQILQLLLDNAD